MPVTLFCILLLLSSPLRSNSSPPTSKQLGSLFNRYAAQGNLAKVEQVLKLQDHAFNINYTDDQGRTSLHHLLAGWHAHVENDGLLRSNTQPRREFLKTLKLILKNGAARMLECPFVDALHFRNSYAFKLLLKGSGGQAPLNAAFSACLLLQDADGQTPLHVAASDTAAGLSRTFVRHRTRSFEANTQSGDNALTQQADYETRWKKQLRFLKLSKPVFGYSGAIESEDCNSSFLLPEYIEKTTLSHKSMVEASTPWFLKKLLRWGASLSNQSSLFSFRDWLEVRNEQGYTALCVACRFYFCLDFRFCFASQLLFHFDAL